MATSFPWRRSIPPRDCRASLAMTTGTKLGTRQAWCAGARPARAHVVDVDGSPAAGAEFPSSAGPAGHLVVVLQRGDGLWRGIVRIWIFGIPVLSGLAVCRDGETPRAGGRCACRWLERTAPRGCLGWWSAASARAVTGIVSAGRCECYVRESTAGFRGGNLAETGRCREGVLGGSVLASQASSAR